MSPKAYAKVRPNPDGTVAVEIDGPWLRLSARVASGNVLLVNEIEWRPGPAASKPPETTPPTQAEGCLPCASRGAAPAPVSSFEKWRHAIYVEGQEGQGSTVL